MTRLLQKHYLFVLLLFILISFILLQTANAFFTNKKTNGIILFHNNQRNFIYTTDDNNNNKNNNNKLNYNKSNDYNSKHVQHRPKTTSRLFFLQQQRPSSSSSSSLTYKETKTISLLNASVVVVSTSSPSISTTLLSIIIHLVLGNIGTPIVLKATTTWYNKINLPTWTPPNKVFAPVWTILYTCMGISISRIISLSSTWYKLSSMNVWFIHILFNIFWAPIFFGLKMLLFGLLIQYGLIVSLLYVIKEFIVIDKLSSILLLPYLIWLLYASTLNLYICKLNPTDKYGYNNAKFQSQLYKLQNDAAKYANL